MKQALGLLFASLLLFNCSSDDEGVLPKGKYEFGIFVINEGNFGESDGSISFIHHDKSVDQAIFSTENDGKTLGDVVQSMHIADDQGYILVNNSNVIEVVNPYTMESTASIEAALPRYMTSSGDMGFFTEWVGFTDPGRVSFVDLTTNQVTDQVTVGFGAEDIIERDGKLYVSNSFGNTVSVIDIDTKSPIYDIEVGQSPKGMVLDQGGNIWVVCSGGYNADWTPANNGQLVRISPSDEVNFAEDLEMNVSGKIAKDMNGLKLYFMAGVTSYVFDIGSPNKGFDVFAENSDAVSFYGIGVDDEGFVYISDSKGFQSNGVVYKYEADGSLENTIDVGRGPNGFAFH